MLGTNNTPFAAIGFEQAHRDGQDMGVIAVRASYTLNVNGEIELAEDQAIVLTDQYAGDPTQTPLVQQADLIPFKPATDVTAIANSFWLGDEPETDWVTGIRVDEHRYALRVLGKRNWTKTKNDYVPSKPEIVNHVPVDYRLSWSDLEHAEVLEDCAPLNPLGIRRPISDQLNEDTPVVMASIEQIEEDYSDSLAQRQPQGFGPIPPFWHQRLQFGGTYDDDWTENRHPQLPEDFDYQFYQCAHPNLIYNGHLKGDEVVELVRLHSQVERLLFKLPALQPYADFLWLDDRQVKLKLNLDGVHINMKTDPMTVDITWRGWLPICPQFFKIDLNVTTLDTPELANMPFSGLYGIEGTDETGEVIA